MGRPGVTNASSSSGTTQTSNISTSSSSSTPNSPLPVLSSPFCRISLGTRPKPLRVMVLGQAGVGKSALVVRFITRRYIGEYDPNLEKVYAFHTMLGGEAVSFEILDTAGQPHEGENVRLESNIRWAEAFVLMYSVTDKCSFDECNRLKFLINYNKRRRLMRRCGGGSSTIGKDTTVGWSISAPWNPWLSSSHFTLGSSAANVAPDTPIVILVGNKTDAWGERMVTHDEGERRSVVCFSRYSTLLQNTSKIP
ncbi:ras-related and estrogen-regulated growth inhibitor isoform X2 [Ischnura elegans]|uniref:ras-related and estrogen-regulated growth inhibitor isoform X2 n=1 Tax=Ischnura elegans TaxID=197161 RepID=UPI001ED89D62|nr:ras-related and estrogen-regulated growth inhibitor isoform X2 [Ischnura elegans]